MNSVTLLQVFLSLLKLILICSRLYSFIFLYLTTDTNFDSMYHGIVYIYWRCKYKMWYVYLYLSNWFFWSMELTYLLSNFAFSSLQESLQLSHLSNWIHHYWSYLFSCFQLLAFKRERGRERGGEREGEREKEAAAPNWNFCFIPNLHNLFLAKGIVRA